VGAGAAALAATTFQATARASTLLSSVGALDSRPDAVLSALQPLPTQLLRQTNQLRQQRQQYLMLLRHQLRLQQQQRLKQQTLRRHRRRYLLMEWPHYLLAKWAVPARRRHRLAPLRPGLLARRANLPRLQA
jgi:hypothetical protein